MPRGGEAFARGEAFEESLDPSCPGAFDSAEFDDEDGEPALLYAGGDADPFAIVGRPVTPAPPKKASSKGAAAADPSDSWKSPDSSAKAAAHDGDEEIIAADGDGFGPGSVYDPSCPGTFDDDADEEADDSAVAAAPPRVVSFNDAVCGKGIRA